MRKTELPAMKLVTPPAYQCYNCQGCGVCCRGYFLVTASREEYERITAQGWENDPELKGKVLFTPLGKRYLLGHRADGACIFLDERGLCRIHGQFGEPAKPLACRLYPFRLLPIGKQARVDIRFDCPAVARNQGEPITEQRAALRELLPQVAPSDAPSPPLYGSVRADWSLLVRLTDAFDRLLREPSLDFTRRIVAGVTLAALLRTRRIPRLEDRQLDEFLTALPTKIVEGTAKDPLHRLRPVWGERVLFRQLLGVYARADRYGERGILCKRLGYSLRMLGGRGLVPPLRDDFPAVRFQDLDGPMGIPDGAGMETLQRYYRMKLSGMGFFGQGFYGWPYLDGMNALLLTYPLTLWFARLFAIGSGQSTLDLGSIERAIQVVNHQHGVVPLFHLPTERFRVHYLCERTHLRSLVIWNGS